MKSYGKINFQRCRKRKSKLSEILIKELLKIIVSITIITVTIHIGSIIFYKNTNINTNIIITNNVIINDVTE